MQQGLRRCFAALALNAAFASVAWAQPPVAVLPAPEAPASCSLSDVTLFDFTPSLACAGFSGVNDANSQGAVATYLNGAFGSAYGPWGATAVGFSDLAGNGPFTSNPNTTSGVLFFDAQVGGFFAITLKGSTGFSLYILDGGTSGAAGVLFDMVGAPANPGGQTPGLSHAGLWRGEGFCFRDCGPPDPSVVPEPAALSLLGFGLVGLAAVRRRRRA